MGAWRLMIGYWRFRISLQKQARQRDDVREFRKNVLGGNLIKFERVEDWITDKAAKDGPSTLILTVPLPEAVSVKPSAMGIVTTRGLDLSKHPAIGARSEFLECGALVKGGTQLIKVPVAMTGTLNRLRMLSETMPLNITGKRGRQATCSDRSRARALQLYLSVKHGMLPVFDRIISKLILLCLREK